MAHSLITFINLKKPVVRVRRHMHVPSKPNDDVVRRIAAIIADRYGAFASERVALRIVQSLQAGDKLCSHLTVAEADAGSKTTANYAGSLLARCFEWVPLPMNTINTPKQELGLPDDNLDYQSSMGRAFRAVAAQAEAAGWDKGEIAYALLELARFKLKGMIADGEIEPQTQAG